MTEDEKPDDRDRDSGEPTLLLLPHGMVAVHEGVSSKNGCLAIHSVNVIPKQS